MLQIQIIFRHLDKYCGSFLIPRAEEISTWFSLQSLLLRVVVRTRPGGTGNPDWDRVPREHPLPPTMVKNYNLTPFGQRTSTVTC